MEISTILASVVAVFGVVMGVAPLLQINRIVRRGQSGDLSLTQLAIVVFGTGLWLAYGLSIGNSTIIISNVVATAVNAATLAFALYFRERPGRARAAVAEA
jgi:uncharacterized protein with PQ loop repeat